MNINYVASDIGSVGEMLTNYINSLTCVVDDFWESHITNATFYKIIREDIVIGYFCMHNSEKIVMFTVIPDYLYLAREIFRDVLDKFNVKTGFAVTGDELLLSLCMENHKEIKMQAIYFDGTIPHTVRDPEFDRSCIQEIDPYDIDRINAETDNFFDFITPENILDGTNLIYQLASDNEILGYGIIVPNGLSTKYWACGMITLEKYRRKGVGRSIQIHLGDICRENGKIPISGCWYYNDLSRKTIESAGRYTTTRLLNVIF
jgi:hypothetical protein